MNFCLHMGRLTRDPEIRNGSLTIARFSLAVDRKYKKEDDAQADFFNFTAFGKNADFVQKYLKQGVKIVVRSHAQNDNYTNKNGEKVYAVNFIVDEIEFAESKKASESKENFDTKDEWMNLDNVDTSELPFN